MRELEIVHDGNEGEVEVKKLGSPIRRTVVTPNTRVDDDGEIDAASLNKQPEKERPKKKTLMGNVGPDSQGKIDWERNPDCKDSILQYHESYQFENTSAGYLQTAEKCYRQFNKLFNSKVTPQEIASALELVYLPNDKGPKFMGKKAQVVQGHSDALEMPAPKQPEKEEMYFPVQAKSLEIMTGKVVVDGTKFEICKILNCPNICLMQRKKGPKEGNKVFVAACRNSKDGKIIEEGCPQEEQLGPKEQFVFQMFVQQFNGDELQAKKFLHLSKTMREK